MLTTSNNGSVLTVINLTLAYLILLGLHTIKWQNTPMDTILEFVSHHICWFF